MTADRHRPSQTGLEQRIAQEQGETFVDAVVDKVHFSNEETGWTAARVILAERDEPASVAGIMLGVAPGDPVRLGGRWTMDPRWGRQFEVKSCELRVPSTREGIRRYLGSGLIEGIGERLAERLVVAFGKETLEVIERAPDRLTEVEGIGPKRAHAIRAALAEQLEIKQVMVFLQGHGLSASKAVKVYKRYGAGAVAKLRQNPYRLADDIFGIGFSSADRIAASLGIEGTAPFRLQAGLIYALGRAAEDGHLYLPETELTTQAAALLAVDEALVADALGQLEGLGRVVVETVSGPEGQPVRACFRPDYYHAERELAERLRVVFQGAGRGHAADWARAKSRVERRLGISLAPTQDRAVRCALESKVVVITGGPGTGKTTIIRGILDVLEAQGLRAELAAPTGRAAKRMQEATGRRARTIHRMLEYLPHAGGFQRTAEQPLEADLVVVDEVSMLDVPLALALVRALPTEARLVLVGDADQLPSVGPGAVLRQIIDSGAVPVVRLTEVFRQAARSQIVVCAHQVNQGRALAPPERTDANRGAGELFVVETEEAERAAQLVERLVVERIPRRYGLDPVDDIQVLCPTKRGRTGTEQLNARLQAALNPGGEQVVRGGQTLRVGDKVMQIRNDYDKEVFNGDLGRVSAIGESELTCRFDGRGVEYKRQELDQLQLAYACTVHKSQGSEYPAVVMPLLHEHYLMLQRNLLYTGITRAQRLFVLVGSPRAIRRAIQNDQVRKRYTTLAERLARPT